MIKFDVPNNEKELQEAEALLKRIHDRVAQSIKLGTDRKQSLLALTTDILYIIGDLSQPIFDLRITMEEAYTRKYLKSPALGKKLYLEHYESLHIPYDKLKNKTFKLIQLIDPTDEGIEEEIYI